MSPNFKFYLLLVIYSMHIAVGTQISSFLGCAAGIFTNKRFLSPINIDESTAISVPIRLTLNPDPFRDYTFTTKKDEQNGVLRIVPKFPSEQRPTLRFLNSIFRLQDIYLFWGKASVEDSDDSNNNNPDTSSTIAPVPQIVVDVGSEHSIGEEFFPIEVRLVYVSSQRNRNLFGLNERTLVKVHFLKVGSSDFLNDDPNKVTTADIIPEEATATNKVKYVAYKGSLTTKPNNKNALWLISTNPGTISQEAFQTLYKEYPDLHNRERAPIQPLCGRKLFKLLNGNSPFSQ